MLLLDGTKLDETGVPLEPGPVVVKVNRVNDRVPYPPYGGISPYDGAVPEAPGEVPGVIADKLFETGKGTELDAVAGDPSVLLLAPVENSPERD